MSKYLVRPIGYLENDDINGDGKLVCPDIPKNMPAVVMVQANFCGYCTDAKKDFQEFANGNSGKVFVATIQGDSDNPSEKTLASRLRTLYPDFQGFPHYVLYDGNGNKVNKQIKGRDVRSLKEFAGI